MPFFQLIRFPNLVIMLCTQVFSYYFLSKHITVEQLIEPRFTLLCLATILVGAGGYIINDYLDVKLDLINKPSKVIVGQNISRRWTMFLHLFFNGIAILLGVFIGIKVTIAILVAALLLWVYSVSLKRKFLIGNIVVALLSAFVIILNFVFDTSLNLEFIITYSLFAFTLTLIREIIKDTEDQRGDGKFDCKTIPIVLGVRKTKSILISTTLGLVLILAFYTFLYGASFPFEHILSRACFVGYMLLFVITPLLVLLYLIRKADTTKDFSRLSSLSKIIMTFGMISMIFWRL